MPPSLPAAAAPALHQRADLARLAVNAMVERKLLPDFPPAVLQELDAIAGAAMETGADIRDLRALLWCSIDNDDSRDLDQITCCEPVEGGGLRLLVAIADVDSLVKQGSAIDLHAAANTASVYTAARIFPMLPERLSTDLTSLNAGADRLAVVTDMVFSEDARLQQSTVYRALVRNQAKLAYDAVAMWLEGQGPLPAAAQAVRGMDGQLRQQDVLAQQLRVLRRAHGALELESLEAHAVFDGEQVVGFREQQKNRARQLIEEIMVATNGCNAEFLAQAGAGSLHRIVRSPERWQRIADIAKSYGEILPAAPDSAALEHFLAKRHLADPLHFADLSLLVMKLMGSGEYVVASAGSVPVGHFGLAMRDYTHSTAPNRRYPDLITSRLLKAAIAGQPSPYSAEALAAIARHCTQQEGAVRKVERRMRKSEAALVLESRIGETFDAIVVAQSPDGAWIRLLSPPVEAQLLVAAGDKPAIGAQVRVTLVSTDVERGFIDFRAAA